MRLVSITLTNYRGTACRKVEFGDITVVVGPNEIGKSSIAEALMMLIDEKATGNNDRTRAIRPTHTGKHPEVELEATSGPYKLSYRKVYGGGRNASSTTALTVSGPKGTETFSGDDAHDRFLEVLGEHSDLPLLSALSMQQTREATQASLEGSSAMQRALAAALDDTAGTSADDVALVDRVRRSSLRWLTDGGNANKALKELRASTEAAAVRRQELAEALAAAARDVEQHDSLSRAITQDTARLPDLERECTEREHAVRALETLRTAVTDARKLHEGALDRAVQLKKSDAERREQVKRLEALTGSLKDMAQTKERLDAALQTAEAERTAEREAYGGARQALETARKAHAAAARRQQYRAAQVELERIRRALEDAVELMRRRRDAAQQLEGHTPDEGVLRQARELDSALVTARALLDAGVPRLSISVETARQVKIDGVPHDLTPLAPLTLNVETARHLAVDGVTATVEPGRSAAELTDGVETAATALRDHLAQYGAQDVAQLAARAGAVAEARRVLKETDAAARRLTAEGGVDGLRGAEVRLSATVADAPADIANESLEDLQSVVDERQRAVAQAEEAAEQAEAQRQRAADALTAAEAERSRFAGEVAKVEGQLGEQRNALDRARASMSDEDLAKAIQAADQAVSDAQGRLTEAQGNLARANPEQAQALLDAAKATLANLKQDLQSRRATRDELKGKLSANAADGLAEKAVAAAARAESLDAQLERAELEAAGARLLIETLERHRDAARQRYAKPLRDRIEALGRTVYSPDFAVELDDQLQIAKRTMHGVTVPFDDLSGGTREQLAVLTRVAAAMLVDPDDGVPVILDDALGFSDPDRLKLFNSLLGRIGDRTQVVVLTCWPDRFIAVPDQHRILLD